MDKTLLGFNSDETFMLYSFLCKYETKIKSLKNNKDVFDNYPELKQLNKLVTSDKFYITSKDIIWGIGVINPNDVIYLTKAKTSLVLSVLYHLRNSIAHGQIKKIDGMIQIDDFEFKNKQPIYSARGNMNQKTIFNIIQIFNECVSL